MADPHLQRRGGGGGGAGHPDPEIRGVGGGHSLKNIFFRPFGPHFGLKIRGGDGSLTWIRHWTFLYDRHILQIAKVPFLKRELTVSIHNHEKRLRE